MVCLLSPALIWWHSWLHFGCAAVVFVQFCVDFVVKVVVFECSGVVFCQFWLHVVDEGARTGWLVCLLWLSFVISGWIWSKTWLVFVCALVVFCEFCVDMMK